MVRQYKIHTNLDGMDDIVYDVTNGKIRFYQPSNLGFDIENSISVTDGIGVVGNRNLTQPDIEFKLETFCDTVKENYEIFNKFINDLLSVRFVTLEYSTESFQVYADLALKNVTKTEGYGRNGQFSENISFQVVTKWYTYENLTFEQIENGQVISGKSKIYGGLAPNGKYNYIQNQAYTYYGETNIQRLSRWDIQQDIFSFVARLVPSSDKNVYGTVFLDEIGNEYTAIVFKPEQLQSYIMINTDVNDEYYQGWNGTTAINLFPVLDFERYRTRIIRKGQMTLYNLSKAEFKIKRKADFV